jgi:dienelactone hydrolase
MKISQKVITFIAALFFSHMTYAGELIKFSSLDTNHPLHVSGELYLPKTGEGKFPAMVVVHGTGGIDERTDYFANELPKIGIAVFVVDYKSGIFNNPMDRPRNATFIPASFAALKLLRARPEIDPTKIGILGFSLGGQQTLTTSVDKNRAAWMGSEDGFAVHVAFYPDCKGFLEWIHPTSKIKAPVLILYGSSDSYGDGEYCPKVPEALANLTASELKFMRFEGGQHGFDGDKREYYKDPASIGPRAYVEGNPAMAAEARKNSIEFLKKYLVSE